MKTQSRVILYYKYAKVADPEGFAVWTRAQCERLGLTGRIIIAHEGINGTLEGTEDATNEYEALLRASTHGDFVGTEFKHSPGTGSAFKKLKVKVRSEIVSANLGDDDVDPNQVTGIHLTPEELHAWYEKNEDFVVVDMRNDYEYRVGRFKGSVNPGMENFRDLPKVMPSLESLKDRKVVTVCTGGVRCEKASGYLKSKGFKDVYQLHGGMHEYMEAYPGKDFEGALYVFDQRETMVTTDDREIVGRCEVCTTSTERYGNCAYNECHAHLLICEECNTKTSGRVYCGDICRSADTEQRSVEGSVLIAVPRRGTSARQSVEG